MKRKMILQNAWIIFKFVLLMVPVLHWVNIPVWKCNLMQITCLLLWSVIIYSIYMKIRKKYIQGWQRSCWGFLKYKNMENQLTCFVSKQRTSYYNSDTTHIVLLSRHIKGLCVSFKHHIHILHLPGFYFPHPVKGCYVFKSYYNGEIIWSFDSLKKKKSNVYFPLNRFLRALSHTCIIFKNRNGFRIIYPRLLSIQLSQPGKSQTVPKASSVLQIMNFPPCNMSVKCVYLFLQSGL